MPSVHTLNASVHALDASVLWSTCRAEQPYSTLVLSAIGVPWCLTARCPPLGHLACLSTALLLVVCPQSNRCTCGAPCSLTARRPPLGHLACLSIACHAHDATQPTLTKLYCQPSVIHLTFEQPVHQCDKTATHLGCMSPCKSLFHIPSSDVHSLHAQ